MRILVFGGSGFLGSYVVDELLDRGHQVAVFDKVASPFLNGRGRMIIGDLLDARQVQEAIRGFEVVYNFAGQADINRSIDQPVPTVTLNIMGNLNVLEGCRTHHVYRFVYASSAYVFSHRGAFYGTSKKCSEMIIEQYAEQFGLDYTIIRYGSVYGERANTLNRLYRIIREALIEGEITFPGNGAEEREYIHGRDAAQLSADILDPAYRNRNVILTGNERFSYRELLEILSEMLGGRLRTRFLDQDYHGHYVLTPYSFSPRVGVKLVNNPSIDFGQGLLECIEHVFHGLREEQPGFASPLYDPGPGGVMMEDTRPASPAAEPPARAPVDMIES
ncbi:MAG: NAD(P)-dependent oxidoreductase [Magnetococcales bacterium]|nr:NAD(P)-dependent oxidoreductase [Magnetococcales bacterium]